MTEADIDQDRIRIWNDAVEACRAAAMSELDRIEAEAGDGMPPPARTLVRAVSLQHRSGDTRRVIRGLDASAFPNPGS